MTSYVVVPGNLDSEYSEDGVNALACCDNKAQLIAIYKGKLHFSIYDVPNPEEHKKRDTINLRRELVAAGISSFNFSA